MAPLHKKVKSNAEEKPKGGGIQRDKLPAKRKKQRLLALQYMP
ncbi:hypothetical protein ACFLVR_05520 [Chloroflexota bacterium]